MEEVRKDAAQCFVALLAEGVDRNAFQSLEHPDYCWSPSSRRAWIEIPSPLEDLTTSEASPSSRRAWIEICRFVSRPLLSSVALLAEGVDRNQTQIWRM